MAKDYKNTRKPKDKQPKALPGWVWLLVGLSIGLFVALLVYLRDASLEQGTNLAPVPMVDKDRPVEPRPETTQRSPQDPPQDKEEQGVQKPTFDFYNLLPEMEVFIPEQDLAAERARKPVEKITYYLQAGSFRRLEEADRLRARLALLNIESQIQRVTVNREQTWHRVRIGPFSSARKMDKVRGRLRAESIDPIVLKTKG
jgi:cell division protein FtsN